MAAPTLIYCADGNAEFARIAVEAGFMYGAQLPPRGLPFPPYFADQNWKKPNRERYMAELEKHKPFIASVLDWERLEQLSEVLGWAEDAARFVDVVMIIPKVIGQVSRLPRVVGGKSVRLGYSIPTKFGGTPVPLAEFVGWPVHLLGGSPKKQRRLSGFLNVVSVDGNYAQKMAVRYNEFWDGSNWCELSDYGGKVRNDAPYEAFSRSCQGIMAMWHTSTPQPNKRLQPNCYRSNFQLPLASDGTF